MRTYKFTIAKFFPAESDGTDAIDIDWPSVHRQAGLDHVQWIRNQDPTDCQLILERKPNDSYTYVVAEIYSEKLATVYTMMWAK